MNVIKKEDFLAKTWRYPGGELGVDLNLDLCKSMGEDDVVLFRVESTEDVFTLMAVCYYINQSDDWPEDGYTELSPKIKLLVPYCPYLREDSPKNGRVAFGKYIVDSCVEGYAAIVMPHAKLNKDNWHGDARFIYPYIDEGINRIIKKYVADAGITHPLFIFPDKSARGRYADSLEGLMYHPSHPIKVRDPQTGKITKYEIPLDLDSYLHGRDVVVLDDICDGGATFGLLAKAILPTAPSCNLHLFTPHGIYSGNAENNLGAYTSIACLNTVREEVRQVHPYQFIYDVEELVR